MKLSIITINYNDSQGLRKTFESIKNQTCKNFEYIVVDGNSNDGSKEVIKEYESCCITKWVSEPDSGIYNAMNKGANMSSGDYMLFLNSGDYLYDNEVIQKVLDIKVDSDIISGCTIDFDDRHEYLKTPPRHISLFTFIGGSLSHPSTFISRKIFQKVGGYSEKYRIISDWCFFIEALLIYNCSYSTIPLIISKFNCFGISSTQSNEEKGACQDFLIEKFGRINDDYLSSEYESLSNVTFWISRQTGIKKKILLLPFQIINRCLKLRNRLSRKISVTKRS